MIKRVAFTLIILLVFSSIYSLAQAPTPSPQHKKLGFWIGTWKIEAEGKETPLWPAGKYYGTMTAKWFEGGFHVITNYNWSGEMGDYSELDIFGYDVGSDEYYCYVIDGFGGGDVFKGKVSESVWIYVTDRKAEGKAIKFRWTVKNESPSLITWKSELSINGGPWILGGEAKAVRE